MSTKYNLCNLVENSVEVVENSLHTELHGIFRPVDFSSFFDFFCVKKILFNPLSLINFFYQADCILVFSISLFS